MSVPLQNDLLLRALLRQPTPRTPLWMMRQAGRYLPEYRATRGKAGSFLNLCMNPELACEVTLQPLERYRLDAAILFSDILTIPHAMNVGLEFEAGEGPKIARPVRTPADIDRLPIPDPEGELRYVMDAVRLIRRELKGRVPLIGFAGSPWTVGTYMVEGGGSKNFQHIKGMLYGAPRELHRLLGVITCATLAYLNAQVAAGAQAVMVFDTWGGALRRTRRRLDHRPRRRATHGAGPRRTAGQPRPERVVCAARRDPCPGGARAGEFRPRRRPRLQPRPRHPSGRAAGACTGNGGGRARVESAVPRVTHGH
jgi:uroporphyrinogen-III decarboxylase